MSSRERAGVEREAPRSGLAELLSPDQRQLLSRDRQLLWRLREALAAAAASEDDLRTLRQAEADLDELFLLVIVGEFNAGKSALINALLGAPVLPEGVTPTTAEVTLLRDGPAPEQRSADGLLEIRYPLDLLRDLAIVDTPGTNAVLRRHEELTRRFIPRADLVLFVTSADRPFTESERSFMELIRTWGKKLVLVLNKVDLLQPAELEEQLGFVREQSRQLLGFIPQVFPVSARAALRAKQVASDGEREQAWAASRFQALEAFIRETLDDQERLRLKLQTPLGVAERIAASYQDAAQQRLELLQADLLLSESLEGQLALYLADMRRDFGFRLHELDTVLHQLQERGERFLDDTLRLGRVFDLFNAARIKSEFERQVVADLPAQVDRLGQSLIDWMVEQDLRLWRSVTEQVERRRAARPGEGPSARLAGSFEYDRRTLLGTLGSVAREVVQRHDHRREAEQLAQSVRETVTQATLMEAGALGLGALVVALVSSAALDVTGILASGAIAGLGLYLLPLKRRRAKEQFRLRTAALRDGLASALSEAFERELEHSVQRVRDALAPYDRFVRVEQAKMTTLCGTLAAILAEARTLREQIQRL